MGLPLDGINSEVEFDYYFVNRFGGLSYFHSDKTFGVKVSEVLYGRVKAMIDLSDVFAKEWFEKAVILTELQSKSK